MATLDQVGLADLIQSFRLLLLATGLGLGGIAIGLAQQQEAMTFAAVLALAGVLRGRASRGAFTGVHAFALDLRVFGMRRGDSDCAEEHGGGGGDSGA